MRRFVMLDFSQITKGFLLERSGSLRKRLSAHKIRLSDVCWVYVEKAPDRGWVDLQGLYLYTIRIYLRDGRIVNENLDSRETNVDERYRTLKRAIPWAIFGYHRKYAAAWKDSRVKFVSSVDERRVGTTKGEDKKPKRTQSEEFQGKQGELRKPLEKDFYEVLGVPRTVTVAELHVRFRELALKYHPDRNRSRDAEDKFKEVSEAYVTVLKDARERLTNE
jgi:DnaJ-domain-containing protein 1